MRSYRTIHGIFTAAGLAAFLTLSGTPALAQISRPFKINGVGVGPSGLPLPGQPARAHWVNGWASYLGNHHGEGTVRTLSATPGPAPNKISGRFGSGSPFVFTGTNGDKLSCDYGDQGNGEFGTFELTIVGFTADSNLIVEALWLADFVVRPEDSTGAFAGVTGSWRMVARSAPFVLGSDGPVGYVWEGKGMLSFPPND